PANVPSFRTEVSSVVAPSVECCKRSFSWVGKRLVYQDITYSLLRNDSTEERNNAAFLIRILTGKLPIRLGQFDVRTHCRVEIFRIPDFLTVDLGSTHDRPQYRPVI